MDRDTFSHSMDYWTIKEYKKGDYFNHHKSICQFMGFVIKGAFRSYIIDEKTGEDKNVFLYSANGFVVTFKSFVNQIPCDYHTQAITDATVIGIGIRDLLALYSQHHAWECFGRLLAQEAFNVTMSRIEGFVFKSPEERYLDLVKQQPDIFNTVPLYHISSYLGIQGPSLSRIRKRLAATNRF
jgi:CRP-like cAMP-binding protein